ncbi:hypothetical protein SUDANB121_02294 [Nocardiopsis dassonvillei]|uniref:hypothetical protein n=1 Tax=Nocardiopsis dassonvillei TaxID=2014 RepID=UPI003F57E30D
MVDEKAPPRKQGLHGWKAALAVFGCGTLAAFGVFGLVLAVFGTFLSTLSSGFGGSSEGAGSVPAVGAQPSEPREDFRAEDFDVCEIVDSITAIQLTFAEESEGPVDESLAGGSPAGNDLVRSGSCSGSVTPAGSGYPSGPWDVDFSYRAVIYSPEDNRDQLAGEYLQEVASEISISGIAVTESGPYDLLDEAQYFYGVPGSGAGSYYAVVARKRSAVILVEFSSADQVTAAAFSNEVKKLQVRLDNDLRDLIPR